MLLELIDKAKRESEEREQRRLAAAGGSDPAGSGAVDTEQAATEHAVTDQSLPGESPGADQL